MIALVAPIFASAFLLFLVQPLVGKHILPWFGGGPGVWSLCLAFYQSTLFLGYVYAHWLAHRVRVGLQPIIHAILFAGGLAALPVLPDATWQPEPGSDPSQRILATLIANVGLPFLLLSSSGPLVQTWATRLFHDRSPYPLFAASNLASLLALLCFPLLIEPALPLSQTSTIWSWAFVACGISLVACASWAARKGHPPTSELESGGSSSRTRAAAPWEWVSLSAVAVVLLLGVTNELCLDVVSIPFLWVLPLAIYLSTLIVCFGWERAYRRGPFALAMVLCILVLTTSWHEASLDGSILFDSTLGKIGLYSVTLFSCCMLAHGELYRLRPAASRLTNYYICISGGGAIGGLFVGLAAPRIFDDYHELPLGIAALWLLFLWVSWNDPHGPFVRSRYHGANKCLAVATTVLIVAATIVIGRPEDPGIILRERSFFGVLTVGARSSNDPPRYQLEFSSGTTLHGVQLVRPAPRLATAYFGPQTGIGFVMRMRPPGKMRNIGVAGLGIGTLAAYGRSGDYFRFYEIDPNVIRIARDEGLFSFLSDSDAEVRVVRGDARLSLQSEQDDGVPPADLLILDVFSSDSIPMHVLTAEAFELYVQRIVSGGAIAIHTSTNYLELVPLIFRLAHEVGFHAVAIENPDHGVSFQSRWAVLSRDRSYIAALSDFACRNAADRLRVWYPDPTELADTPLWTDDYSDPFRMLSFDQSFRDPTKGWSACSAGRLQPADG